MSEWQIFGLAVLTAIGSASLILGLTWLVIRIWNPELLKELLDGPS